MNIHNICQLLHIVMIGIFYFFALISFKFHFGSTSDMFSWFYVKTKSASKLVNWVRCASKENQYSVPFFVLLSVILLRFDKLFCCVLPPLLMKSLSRQIKRTKGTIWANSKFVKTQKISKLKNFTKHEEKFLHPEPNSMGKLWAN